MRKLFKTIVAGVSAAALALTGVPGTPLAIESVFAEDPTVTATLSKDGESDVTVTVTYKASLEYTGDPISPNSFIVSIVDGVPADKTSSVTVFCANTIKNKGDYTLSFTGADDWAGRTTATTVSVSVTPKPLTSSEFTVSGTSMTQGGTAPTATLQAAYAAEGQDVLLTGSNAAISYQDRDGHIVADITQATAGEGYKLLVQPNASIINSNYSCASDLEVGTFNIVDTPATYAMTIGTSEHGSIVVKNNEQPQSDGATFEAGTTLTVTKSTADTDYELTGVEVNPSDPTQAVSVIGDSEGVFTFTSPSSNFTVTGVFKESSTPAWTVSDVSVCMDDEYSTWKIRLDEGETAEVVATITGTDLSADNAVMPVLFSYDSNYVTVTPGNKVLSDDATIMTLPFTVSCPSGCWADVTVSCGDKEDYCWVMDSDLFLEDHGALVFYGDLQEGVTLNAEFEEDDDVIDEDELVYTWYRSDGKADPNGADDSWTWNEIGEGKQYKLTSDDVGYYVGVEAQLGEAFVTFTRCFNEVNKVTAKPSGGGGTGGGGVKPQPTPTPEPTPGIVVPTDPSEGKTADGAAETTTTTDPTTGAETTTSVQKNTDESTTTKIDTTNTDGSTIDLTRVDEKNGDYAETSVSKDKDGNVTSTSEASKTTDENGTVTVKSESTDKDGTEKSETVTKTNGDFESTFEKTDENGVVVEASKESKETASDGTVTEKLEAIDINGSTTSETVTKPNGDYTEKTVVMDASGKVTESVESSKETAADGTVTEKEVTTTPDGSVSTEKVVKENGDYETIIERKDADGNVIESTESSLETAADGTYTNIERSFKDGVTTVDQVITNPDKSTSNAHSIALPDGSVDTVNVNKDASGAVEYIATASLDKDGQGTAQAYDVVGTEATLTSFETTDTSIVIPDTIVDMDGTSYPITTIGEGSIPAGTEVVIGQNISKIEAGAFTKSGAKKITLTGSAQKGMFGKGSLEGAGKKNGKGLTIEVQSKKDKKIVKKDLKKSGAKKAKVVVAK